MDETGRDVLARLFAGLVRQRDLYRRLEEEATALRQAADANPEEADVAAILAATEKKQQSLDELAEVESALAPLREEWVSVRDRYSPSQRQPLSDLVEELGKLMQAVVQLEEENSRLVRQHTEALGREVERVRRARRAGSAYKEHETPGHPRFYDRKE